MVDLALLQLLKFLIRNKNKQHQIPSHPKLFFRRTIFKPIFPNNVKLNGLNLCGKQLVKKMPLKQTFKQNKIEKYKKHK